MLFFLAFSQNSPFEENTEKFCINYFQTLMMPRKTFHSVTFFFFHPFFPFCIYFYSLLSVLLCFPWRNSHILPLWPQIFQLFRRAFFARPSMACFRRRWKIMIKRQRVVTFLLLTGESIWNLNTLQFSPVYSLMADKFFDWNYWS